MSAIFNDIHSDINFLENEKFDFDLPFSPTLPEDTIGGKGSDGEEDEVFFGPVGFTEQCMSTRVASTMQEENLKPLSPLSGEQAVELFTEATKLALHIQRLSTETSETSLDQSHTSSERSSISNSYLKLSNRSSSSSHSQVSSVGNSSSGESNGRSVSDLVENDKENIPALPNGTSGENNVIGNKMGRKKAETKAGPLAQRQLNTPVTKVKKGIPRPGSRGISKLPRSKNTEKTFSAFNSPIKAAEPHHQNGVEKNDNSQVPSRSQLKNPSVEKSGRGKSQQVTKLSSHQKSFPSDKGTPSKTSKVLTKRNIFRSTESLSEGATKDARSKLPVPEQRKIPGPKSHRRRSNSTSSISSQSSTSSTQSHAPHEESASKMSKLTKQIPSTKASLASSLPLGLLRRSSKVHAVEGTNDKKAQPIKALPRSTVGSWKYTNSDTPSGNLPDEKVRTSSDEIINEKVPLAATPQPVKSLLPVLKRRSSIKRPATTGKKASAGEIEGSQRRRSGITSHMTPKNQDGKTQANATRKTRRSLLPTPSRSTSIRSRTSSDDLSAAPVSPAVTTKKRSLNDANEGNIKSDLPEGNMKSDQTEENIQMGENDENVESAKTEENIKRRDSEKENANGDRARDGNTEDLDHLLINTDSPCKSYAQSVDDLLQLDDTVSLMPGIMPIQPKPIPQVDLIDLSGI